MQVSLVGAEYCYNLNDERTEEPTASLLGLIVEIIVLKNTLVDLANKRLLVDRDLWEF